MVRIIIEQVEEVDFEGSQDWGETSQPFYKLLLSKKCVCGYLQVYSVGSGGVGPSKAEDGDFFFILVFVK